MVGPRRQCVFPNGNRRRSKLTTHKSVFVRFPLRDRENEFILVWTTTPWTLTSNIVAAVNPELDYIKLQAKKDDAIYYFAKENLNYQRLATEFKEGFGRPEWKWPKNVPKLKTLAQIFKEQGGFEELGTIKGAALVGWTYDGPFDDLDAQQTVGGVPFEDTQSQSGAQAHQVIDGGRDNKGEGSRCRRGRYGHRAYGSGLWRHRPQDRRGHWHPDHRTAW